MSHIDTATGERQSRPKDRIRILLLEGIHDTAVDCFARAGYDNIVRQRTALDGEALAEAIRGVHILGIRSRTQLTDAALAAGNRLLTVGCFCIGTNQVDLKAARGAGVPVFNAPFSNTRSVAELTLAEIIMLMRGIPTKSEAAHRGVWDKSAANSWEVRGKTLGIVGYGNIGSQLSVLAESLGMRVLYHDVLDKLPLGNAAKAESLRDLLARSDVTTLHVPETAETNGLIGAEELRAMKPGAILINNSRGSVVDLDAAAVCLRERHLGGAAIDVFPEEPGSNNEVFRTPLQNLPNVILTPHIGGSTAEAQARIGEEVARKLIDYSDTGATLGAVNFPQVQLPARSSGTRYMHLHRNVPGLLRQVNDVFAKHDLNITAEYLQTDGDLGYVVVEAESGAGSDHVLAGLRAIPGTIRARLLH
jgi:D-3-phosphoglycerate dehydrogenase